MDCQYCKIPLSPERLKIHSTYCNDKCRREEYKRRYYHYTPRYCSPETKLSSGTVGAISELVVATDLLSKGYEVFRALSPSASCDLAILRNGTLIRLEVRTASRNLANGHISMGNKHHRADVLAMVIKDGIVYEPELPN